MSAPSLIILIAKGLAYAIVWIAAAATLLRGVVGPLWGSASDYGLAGAVLALAGGILALAWLAAAMLADLSRTPVSTRKESDQ